jgi:hypothetical protein
MKHIEAIERSNKKMLVKFQIPKVGGTRTVAGMIKSFDYLSGRFEVKTQNDGYFMVDAKDLS